LIWAYSTFRKLAVLPSQIKVMFLTLVDLYDVSEVACVPSVGKFIILIL